jgi:hypothetical protein
LEEFQEGFAEVYHQMDLFHASIKGNKPHTQSFKETALGTDSKQFREMY